jgi:hypothetical protein
MVGLTELILHDNEYFTDDTLRALTRLTSLTLDGEHLITDWGLAGLSNLTHLTVWDSHTISGEFLQSPMLRASLTEIDFHDMPVVNLTDLNAFLHFSRLKKLEYGYEGAGNYTTSETKVFDTLRERGCIVSTY